jgi:hypothetical protein
VGAFLGSWLGGVFVEATGSYDGMWLRDMALAAAAAALALTIREPATAPKTAPAAAVRPALARIGLMRDVYRKLQPLLAPPPEAVKRRIGF